MPDNVDFIQEQQTELLERQINAAVMTPTY